MRIAFVFGDTGSGYSGGDMLVYRLANRLTKQNQVEFVRLVDWRRAIGPYLDPKLLELSDQPVSLRRRAYGALNRRPLLKGLATKLVLTPSQESVWPLDPTIRLTNFDGKHPIASRFDHAVATSWMSAYFVDREINAEQKHYLIQNFEDSPIYSGEMAKLVPPTYSLGLHKIVISGALKSKFNSENPSLVFPGVDPKQFHPTQAFELRPHHSLILPLKAARYKGTREGFDASARSRAKHPDLTLTTFGNKYAGPLAGVRPSKWCSILHNPSTQVLNEALNSARFLLFPSAVEGFPVAPLEAMAAGGLVISTPNTGTAAYLVDGENAFVATGFDSISLQSAIERAFDDARNHARMLARAKETPREFTWDRTYGMFSEALGL
jgi:glycosyltransferase involved in cell wall biosynthesis